MGDLKPLIRQLRDSLDNVTLRKLTEDKELQEELATVATVCNDFLAMLNPKYRPFVINIERDGRN